MHPSVSGLADGSVFTKASSMVTATVEFSNQEGCPVLAVFIGVRAPLIFGSADFAGGVAAKRISAVRVTAIGGPSGLVLLLLILSLFPSAWSTEAVLLGVVTGITGITRITGITGAFAVVLLYACLAIGPMSILSPLTAVISAVVPVLSGVTRGERLNALGSVAIVVALAAVMLVGFVPEKGAIRPSLRALAMAVGAGALIGVFLILIDLTPHDSGLVPLVVSRTVNAIVMFSAIGIGALWARRHGIIPKAIDGWKPGLVLAIIAGAILLAAIVLRERIAPVQIIGLVLALVVATLLAVGQAPPW